MIRIRVALRRAGHCFSRANALGQGVAYARFSTGLGTSGLFFAVLLLSVLGSSNVASALAPGTDIENVATASYSTGGPAILVSSNTVLTTTVVARTAATIEYLRYDPLLGSPLSVDSSQLCSTSGMLGGPFVPMPNPTDGSGSNLDLSAPLPLRPGALYLAGEPVFVEVRDFDQNLDAFAIESVEVRYAVGATGDVEAATLFETGLDTGVFRGSIMLAGTPAMVGDCELAVAPDTTVQVEYVDPSDASDSAQATAFVDPAGVLFDSGSGGLIDAVSVSLVDANTGIAATVYGDDGVSSYPATVVTGSSATDSGGRVYAFAPGQYRFPMVPPGNYRLVVSPPTGYRAPSSVPTPVLQGLPGAPFNIVQGSRGEAFLIAVLSTVDVDIPLDVESSGLFVSKVASKNHVGKGEFLEYRVGVVSGVGTPLAPSAVLMDTLPVGFRYQEHSGRLSDGTRIEPSVSRQGRELRFDLGDIAPGDSLVLSYVVAVTQGAKASKATNSAVVVAQNGLRSNVAEAVVTVVEDRFESRVLLMGRVTLDECGEEIDAWEAGVPAVRLYLEDGTFVFTDERGRFHIEGVKTGVHVLQLDETTLPEGYEAVSCNGDPAFAREPLSQFVDAQPGTLWRTDFHLRRMRGQLEHQLFVEREEGGVKVVLEVEIGVVGLEKLSAVVLLPENFELVGESVLVDGQPVQYSLVDGTLSMPIANPGASRSIEIAFSSGLRAKALAQDSTNTIRVFLMGKDSEGKAVRSGIVEASVPSPETSGRIASEALALELVAPIADLAERLPSAAVEEIRLEDRYDRYWLDSEEPGRRWIYPAEDFIPGIASLKLAVIHHPDEDVELILNGKKVSGLNNDGTLRRDDQQVAMTRWRGVDLVDGANHFEVIFSQHGVEQARLERTIHFTGGPVSAEFVEERSTLVADGQSVPVVAVRLRDRAGRLVREGVTGQFRVDTPYQSRQEVDELRRSTLSGLEEVQPSFVVGKDGIAMIELYPTSVVGRVKLTLELGVDNPREVKAWLSPGDRDWILVAVADGTLGYNDTSGNAENRRHQDLEDDFFQEGRIAFFAKGTVRGDWLLTLAYDSDKDDEEVGRRLKQVIDPDEYFTLYADGTQQGYDAASSEKLYVKIERDKFYALYGDFETTLNETELSAYNRTLTGVKTEFYGENLRVTGFVSETNQFFQRDEIRGRGTSGLYRLSFDRIVIGSDKVSIQTRDRFQSEKIIEDVLLISGVDYNINYLDGTIYFRQPILSRDRDLNPIYIIAEYEVESDGFDDFNGGGRIAGRFKDGAIEIGVSGIHQQAGELKGDLVGLDGRYRFGKNSEIRAEVAYSSNEDFGKKDSGVAYLVEVERTKDDTRARAYVRETPSDFGLGQQNLSELGTRKYGVEITHQWTPELLVSADFFRHENLDNDNTRNVAEVNGTYVLDPYTGTLGVRLVNEGGESTTQLLYGASRNFFDRRLDLYTRGEVGLQGEDERGDFGDRFLLGADFKINDRVTIFGQNEFLWTDGQDSVDTRAGFRVTPWQGASINTAYTHETMENGTRGYANLGLTQTFKLGKYWSLSGSLERSQTVLEDGFEPFDSDVPLTTGDRVEDFTASAIGVSYQKDGLSTTLRFENRVADFSTNWGVFLSALREYGERTSYAGNLQYFYDDRDDGSRRQDARLRLSLAHRPDDSDWIVLNRLDLEYLEDEGPIFSTETSKIVNHFKANHLMTSKIQVAYQVGAKYIRDTINGQSYDTIGGIFGVEARYTFLPNWDFSLYGRTRHTFDEQIIDTNAGVSLGHSVIRNVWVSVGYNFTGFYDEEFSSGEYTTQGPYIRFRVKLDQNSVRAVLERFRGR